MPGWWGCWSWGRRRGRSHVCRRPPVQSQCVTESVPTKPVPYPGHVVGRTVGDPLKDEQHRVLEAVPPHGWSSPSGVSRSHRTQARQWTDPSNPAAICPTSTFRPDGSRSIDVTVPEIPRTRELSALISTAALDRMCTYDHYAEEIPRGGADLPQGRPIQLHGVPRSRSDLDPRPGRSRVRHTASFGPQLFIPTDKLVSVAWSPVDWYGPRRRGEFQVV